MVRVLQNMKSKIVFTVQRIPLESADEISVVNSNITYKTYRKGFVEISYELDSYDSVVGYFRQNVLFTGETEIFQISLQERKNQTEIFKADCKNGAMTMPNNNYITNFIETDADVEFVVDRYFFYQNRKILKKRKGFQQKCYHREPNETQLFKDQFIDGSCRMSGGKCLNVF